MLESNKLCSASKWLVEAKIFSVNGPVRTEVAVGSGSKCFSKVDVTVM